MPNHMTDAKEIFLRAIENHDLSDWGAYLDSVCGDDRALRSEVEKLLAAHRSSDSFLDEPTVSIKSHANDQSGGQIGPFKLLQQIGEGGFGVVYMAQQDKPIRRKVALKIIKPGMGSKEVIGRFEAERQALAMMDHPNIAKVLDAGTTDSGSPYFAMELVKGVSITEYADVNHLSTRDRLSLFRSVCLAIHHAHQKGVIHRDLKPSNVMVTLHDGKPVPKVIDFGVSKAISQPLTEQTLFTRYGQVIGTPQYMSPEQAEMSGLDVDTRSDVYSLGVLLYELLTGRTPFSLEEIRNAGFDEMRRLIREQDPIRPSNILQTLDADTATAVASNRAAKPELLRRLVRGELDWIVMRSLEKDRNRRYDSANGLADDIQRHLDNEPIEASPPSVLYSLRKVYHRHRGVSIAAGMIAATFFIATCISLFAMQSAKRSARRAESQRELAERARVEADRSRQKAIASQQQADRKAKSSQQTTDLLLTLMAKADRNPNTGEPYTVRGALMELSAFCLAPDGAIEAAARSTIRLSDRGMLGSLEPEAAIQLNMGLAESFRNIRSYTLATSHFERAFELFNQAGNENSKERADCLRHLGFLQGEESLIRESLEMERSLTNNDGVVASLTMLGQHLMRVEQHDAAILALEEASKKIRPRADLDLDEVPQYYLAQIYHQQKNDAATASTWENKAVEFFTDARSGSASYWLTIGKIRKEEKRSSEAEMAFLISDYLHEGGKANPATLELGTLCFQRGFKENVPGMMPRASDYFRRYLESSPRDDRPQTEKAAMQLGWALYLMGDYEQAVTLFKEQINRGSRYSCTSIGMLRLLAMQNSEVQSWLEMRREDAKLSYGEPDGSTAKKNAAWLLAAFDVCDGKGEQALNLITSSLYSGFRTSSLHQIAYQSGYPDLALFYVDGILSLRRNLSQERGYEGEKLEWNVVDVARKYYHCGDTEQGEAMLREALQRSREREKLDPFLHYWLCYELGLLIRKCRPEEAQELLGEVADGLKMAKRDGKVVWWYEPFDRAVELHCIMLAKRKYDPNRARQDLRRQITCSTSDLIDYVLRCARAEMYLREHDPLGAITELEECVRRISSNHSSVPILPTLEQLVALYLKTGETDRGSAFLEETLARWDAEFAPRHPWRGFLRIELASILQESGGQETRARQLLEEAKEIVALHDVIPDSVHDRIEQMLASSVDN